MPIWSRTTRRLLLVFSALLGILGAASYFALSGLTQVQESFREVARVDDGMRRVLALSSAVREQYAHIAHTIILGNTTHLSLHARARSEVLRIARDVGQYLRLDDEKEWLNDIETGSLDLQVLLDEAIVPAVLNEDATAIQKSHDQALEIVRQIQVRVELLSDRFEGHISALDARARRVAAVSYRLVFLSLISAIGFASVVVIYLGRSIARPLARLEAYATQLARGDLEASLTINSNDEFASLSEQFNRMAADLRVHQQKLVDTEKLAALGRMSAGVAHEINNPLGVIIGYTRLLQKKAAPELLPDLGVISEEALRCRDIVQGLLDLSRPLKHTDDTVDLRQQSEDIVDRLSESGIISGQKVSIDGEALIEGNARALAQVLTNLVKNAAEAAGPEGRMWIDITSKNGNVCLRVRDSGPGIPESASRHLFEPFFTTKETGTGLGLAISRAIVQAHGGTLDAGNEEDGAVFCVTLPLRPTVRQKRPG